MRIMVLHDMFAHKLFDLTDRGTVTNRDIFDCWFFMEKQTPINKSMVETRMNMPFAEYIEKCIYLLESLSDKGLLHGMGDLMEPELKNFVKTRLRKETIALLKFYLEFPLYS